jgi:hypothetical protein
MIVKFKGNIWFWRGPSPYLFVTVPDEQSRDLKAISGLVTYGWGMIPVHTHIGATEWQTSLFSKEGRYLVPIKVIVQKVENLLEGDEVTILLEVRL